MWTVNWRFRFWTILMLVFWKKVFGKIVKVTFYMFSERLWAVFFAETILNCECLLTLIPTFSHLSKSFFDMVVKIPLFVSAGIFSRNLFKKLYFSTYHKNWKFYIRVSPFFSKQQSTSSEERLRNTISWKDY